MVQNKPHRRAERLIHCVCKRPGPGIGCLDDMRAYNLCDQVIRRSRLGQPAGRVADQRLEIAQLHMRRDRCGPGPLGQTDRRAISLGPVLEPLRRFLDHGAHAKLLAEPRNLAENPELLVNCIRVQIIYLGQFYRDTAAILTDG